MKAEPSRFGEPGARVRGWPGPGSRLFVAGHLLVSWVQLVAVVMVLSAWLVWSPAGIGFWSRGVPVIDVIGGAVLPGIAGLFGLAAIRCRFWSFPALCLLMLVLVGCNPERYPQTTLLPRGDFARIADDLLDTAVKWALLVFVLVEGVLVYAIFRFRGKPGDPVPHQTYGNTVVEIIWTVIPAGILAAIAVPTVKAIFQTNAIPPEDALTVEVVGHQWWWEFRYPEYHLTTANEIHIPTGRTVSLRMGSADVIHSFWVPQLAAKREVFPNRETRMWFKAEKAGEYRGQCAEFCGLQHARMAYWIRAQEPKEFQAWLTHLQGLRGDPAVAAPTSRLAESVRATRGGVSPSTSDSAAKLHGAGATLHEWPKALRYERLYWLSFARRGQRTQGYGRAEPRQHRRPLVPRRGDAQEHG